MIEAREPGRCHILRAGPPGALRPVPGQDEPCLLARGVQLVPDPVGPVGVRLVGEQLAVGREDGGKGIVSRRARRHRQPGTQRVGLGVDVDRDLRGKPEVREVGAEQGGTRLAKLRERGTGHRQRLRQRAGGGPRLKTREQFLTGEIACHPAAGADQEQCAEPPGARPRPRSRRPVARRDGELTEQPGPDRLPRRHRLSGQHCLHDSRGHTFIIAGWSDIPHLLFLAQAAWFSGPGLGSRWTTRSLAFPAATRAERAQRDGNTAGTGPP